MPSFTVLTLAFFILLAIAGGIVGIMLEGKRIPQHSGAHNPATQDAVFPIVGWAALGALYLAVEHVGAGQLTPELRMQLVALALLYATLATAWLIWRSG